MRIVPTSMLLLLLFTLPALPAVAQERCVDNFYPLSPAEKVRLATLQASHDAGNLANNLYPEFRYLQSVTKANWDKKVYAGNGWVDLARDTCVLHMSSSNQPVLGTLLYWYPATVEVAAAPMEAQAVVASGPARIRSGPGLEHDVVGLCGTGWSLTVWTPAQDGWLQASCYGANGWIHESLVSVSG